MKLDTKKLTLSSLMITLGVVLSPYAVPVGVAKCYPWQHLINVISAILLGPLYTLMTAFSISVIRNFLGLGTLLAFPGSLFGGLLASILYQKFSKTYLAFIGEVIGTGLIGALFAYPVAVLFMGKSTAVFAFVIPFMLSSFVGALAALIIFEFTTIKKIITQRKLNC